jgi:predicted glutamine amidotransferase
MGALVAVLQNDANLMRCQLARLAEHVALADPERLPDAYGFGYYTPSDLLMGKRPTGAPSAMTLSQLVGDVATDVLVAHARYATLGNHKEENTQPFRFRRWLFAHDGSVDGFPRVKPQLLAFLPEFLRRNIEGETDSEHVFMVFLRYLRDAGRLDDLDLPAEVAAEALSRTVRQVDAWCREAGAQKPSTLNLVATNGRILAACRRGRPLSYALLEGIVPCAAHGIGPATPEGDPQLRPHRIVKAVCFASRLLSPNGFLDVPEGSAVAVSRNLRVSVSTLSPHA